MNVEKVLPGRLERKVILVTGAAGGQGRAAVNAFAREGAFVVATDLGAAAEDLPDGVPYLTADLADPPLAQDVVARAVELHGRLDGLYCNHAIVQPMEPIFDTSLELYDRLADVNQRSVFVINQAAARAMRDSGGGSIVNVASVGALRAVPGLAVYSMTKAAITHLSRVLAMELAEHGIRVNVICPGAIDTEMALTPTAHLPAAEREQMREAVTNAAAMRRMGQPEEVVAMGVHLLSDDASYTTGAVIAIDGGM